jgi:hypothetical protein
MVGLLPFQTLTALNTAQRRQESPLFPTKRGDVRPSWSAKTRGPGTATFATLYGKADPQWFHGHTAVESYHSWGTLKVEAICSPKHRFLVKVRGTKSQTAGIIIDRGCLTTGCWEEYLDQRSKKWREVGEFCITRSCMICQVNSQVEENKMIGVCSSNGQKRNRYTLPVEQPERKRPLWRPK